MQNSSNEYHLVPFKKNKISIYEMILVFAIASIIGYFIETGYVFFSVGKLVKRGMLIGPYCPIYGFGALILYSCFYNIKSNTTNLPIIFIISSLILGSFELICGLIFKYTLNIEMWNYSNIWGHIGKFASIPTSAGWALMSLFYVYVLKKMGDFIISKIPRILSIILSIIFFIDCICSIMKVFY